MKINQIIKEQRQKKGLTQEQVAKSLGVSTPAVNKWERGATYPDITLLPPLARLLGVDLNTLLSFQEDLTDYEIGEFMNEIYAECEKNGVERAYEMAIDRIQEYPNCQKLILNTALMIDGLLIMSCGSKEFQEVYESKAEELYQRASLEEDERISQHARAMLIKRLAKREEYDEAKALLDQIPDPYITDKVTMQVNLHMQQGHYEEAAVLMESKIIGDASSLQSSLITLMDIALENNRIEDAQSIAERSKELAKLFDLWEYNQYVAHFQLYLQQKDAGKLLGVLKQMIPAMKSNWDASKSELYRSIPANKEQSIGQMLLPKIIAELKDEEKREYDFIRELPEFWQFIAEV